MRKTTFQWLTVFATGAALFSAGTLWVMISELRRPKVKLARVRGDYQSIGSALKIYAINAGRPPSTEQGLQALVSRPTIEPLPEDWVQTATSVPTDPWKNTYHYRELPPKDGAFRWELSSVGPDGKLGTTDDRQQEFSWKPGP